MSKAATKSLKDKKGVSVSSTPVVTHEIIQEKLTDQEWVLMVIKDDDENFIQDICDEIVNNAISSIYISYLEHQVIPYTLSLAKDAFLHIIEWQFLVNDVGQKDSKTSSEWELDEENSPCVIDCWAQGTVPVLWHNNIIPDLVVEEASAIERTTEQDTSKSDLSRELSNATMDKDVDKNSPKQKSIYSPHSASVKLKSQEILVSKPKTPYKRHRGKLRSAGVSHISETLEETENRLLEQENALLPLEESFQPQFPCMPAALNNFLKLHHNRGLCELKMNEYGKVISMWKVNHDQAPSKRVNIQFKLAKKRAVFEDPFKKSAAKFTSSKDSLLDEPRRSEILTPTRFAGLGCQTTLTDLPAPIIDNINLAPGVSVREGDKMRKGSPLMQVKEQQFNEHSQNLKPISLLDPTCGISLDLMNHQRPTINILRGLPVLPPVNTKN